MVGFVLSFATILASAAAALNSSNNTCTNAWEPISASDWVSGSNPGWNLGNTLDATPTEGSWNNPPVDFSTFDDVKNAGFKGVRLPVTWAYHFDTESPSWTINATWLQRVSDVVDSVIAHDMHVLVNAHHDSWIWADVTATGANYTMIEEKFYRLWYQVGTALACKSSALAFEPINEPPGTTAAHAAELNKLQGLFIQALFDSGGFNSKRVVTLVGLEENGDLTDQFFVAPANMTNPYAIQYHYYSPYDFIFGAWGKSIWGSDDDKASVQSDISIVRGNFTNVPIIIGEWQASPSHTETAARWKYYDTFIRLASKYTTATIMWDNGGDQLDRAAHKWRDQIAVDILMEAVAGNTNSLPDSTTDASAATQSTSAYIFHQASTTVTDIVLPYLFNGNSLRSIHGPNGPLIAGTDYVVSGSNITYKASFLSKYFSTSVTPGSKANLTLQFSSGAPLTANIVQYDTPVLASNTSAASAVTSGSDLDIPITWKGVDEIAAVKAVMADGTGLVDSWTIYLGPLQQDRMTYSSQYSWSSDTVIITAAAVEDVVAAGQTTTFTFEFYPRVPGNAVNYTLTV